MLSTLHKRTVMDSLPFGRRLSRREFAIFAAAASPRRAAAQPTLPAAEVERFLAEARVVSSRPAGAGIANTKRFTLSDGKLTHDAHFQAIDESRRVFEGRRGTEINFRDTWKFNVAACRLDRLLELHMTPPSIARGYAGQSGAFTWWIYGALMEIERQRRKIKPPDARFNNQMHALRVFDQLIFNTDRNMQNALITPDWKLWLIDHTRAFRIYHTLLNPQVLIACDRTLLAGMKKLNLPELKAAMEGFLTDPELEGLLKRRDRIVSIFEQLCARKGEDRVLYDLIPRRAEYPAGQPPNRWPEP